LLFNYNNYGGRKSFWEGIYFSRRIKQLGIEHIHAHFAWKAADIAIIIKRFTNIPYSLTAHQSDIHRTPERLYEKLSEAKFVLTCTKGNKEYIIENYGKKIGGKTFCVYHGVNVENFMPKEGKDEKPVDILCIGNLIKVKGFEYLIEACAILNANGLFEKCLIVGKGEEKNNLESLIEERRLEYKIEIKAPVPYDDVVNLYKMSKLFVLPVTVINGAPHGIPNVLMEAMAMEIPVVTTGIPHIPELIEHKKNGILLMDKDPQAIAEAIDKLLNDDEERIRLGENARQKIVKEFDSKIHITHLVSLFRSKLIHSENTERIKL